MSGDALDTGSQNVYLSCSLCGALLLLLISYYRKVLPTKQIAAECLMGEHKDLYRERRDAFREDQTALDELKAWKQQDKGLTYQKLYDFLSLFVSISCLLLGTMPITEIGRALYHKL